MLSFATGNLDRRGGNMLSVGFYKSAEGGPARLRRAASRDASSARCARVRCRATCSRTRSRDRSEPVRALFVVAGNPLLSIGGEARLREAFEALELLVCVDLYRNATGEYADWLLPSTDMFERADINLTGLGLQHRPWVQFDRAGRGAARRAPRGVVDLRPARAGDGAAIALRRRDPSRISGAASTTC